MSEHGTSIMQRLRGETSDLHKHAESRVLQKQIARGDIDRHRFAAYLAQLLHVHRALETALHHVRDRHPTIAALATPDRMRVPDLERDLGCFGVDPAAVEPSPAAERFVRLIADAANNDPVALLGAFYVVEGSTNGGRFLARALRRSWGPDTGGLATFDPYGDDQARQWAAFKAEMDRGSFDESQRDAVVALAKATFEAIADISDEVATVDRPEEQLKA